MKKYKELGKYKIPTREEARKRRFNTEKEYQRFISFYIEQNKEIDFQNDRFRKFGIPPNAIKLETRKNYSGRADGCFEIITIKNELWFVPGRCVEFYEEEEELTF